MKKAANITALCALAMLGCDLGTGPDNPGRIEVHFRAQPQGQFSVVAAEPVAGSPLMSPVTAMEPISVWGTNGTLLLEEAYLVIAEFELEGDSACEDSSGSGGDDCDEFEAPPSFLALPLDGEPVTVATDVVPPGVYDQLDFEVEDLEVDDDGDDGVTAQSLLATIRNDFPDWPKGASMLITGTFTPTNGDAIPFRVYFDAEIEIELNLSPPLVVGADGPSDDLVVDVAPDLWFRQADGTVTDLSQFDYDQTGRLLFFELELGDGFTRVHREDD